MRTYLISWTYADKLHTFSLHYKITKTSSKTGFTQFCYSFRSHYIFLFGKSQIIFLSFYTHPISHHICNFQRKPSYDCVKWSYYTYYWVLPTFQPVAYNCLLVSTLDQKKLIFLPSNITFHYTCYCSILKAIFMLAEERSATFPRHSFHLDLLHGVEYYCISQLLLSHAPPNQCMPDLSILS